VVKIFPASQLDSRLLARDLRPSDEAEIAALHGITVSTYDALEFSRLASHGFVWSAFLDGDIVAMFGTVDLGRIGHNRMGSPWLLCSNKFADVPVKQVLKTSRAFMQAACRRFNFMYNYVHEGNEKTLRWLHKCGFHVHKTAPYGPYGEPFYKITIGGFNV
jgi:hypothetical protein